MGVIRTTSGPPEYAASANAHIAHVIDIQNTRLKVIYEIMKPILLLQNYPTPNICTCDK